MFYMHKCSTMSVFTKKVSPITGKTEWQLQNEDYDFHQEIARSAFADMLHDTERNQKYYTGIRLAIEQMHARGKKANVLDIGTGTGLLSMMAAKCGADSIVACEAFHPIAECAKKIVSVNGFEDKIKVLAKRSTDLTVGEDGDLKQRANILVTEVFDTELIGEGAILTFSHAHQELLEKDCIVVPMSATIYAQVVESELAQKWNKLHPIVDGEGDTLVDTPPEVKKCPGAAAVHDIQLSQFPSGKFSTILSPQPVLRFDWSGRTPIPREQSNIVVCKAERTGIAHVVFMWWDLIMDTEGEVLLTCAPVWAHPNAEKLPWRDHWLQAVYYLPQEVEVKQGEELTLISSHDEYSLWFNLRKDLKISPLDYLRPVCECGVHASFSRTRIGAMNDCERNRLYLAALKNYVTRDSVCACLSEGCLLGLVAAKLGAKKVYCFEKSVLAKRVLQSFIDHNQLEEKIVVLDDVEDMTREEIINKEVNLVLGEPHFFVTLLPWHNIQFWYLKQRLAPLLSDNVHVLPTEATIWAMAVEFEDLWKIRAPLHSVEGFVMTDFDKLIENSSAISDLAVEAHPLWEYPCRALSRPQQILNFNFSKSLSDVGIEEHGRIRCEGSGTCHAVVLWSNWDLDGSPKHQITTGPMEPVHIDEHVTWDMYSRQGVYFLPVPEKIDSTSGSYYLHFSVKFQPFDDDVFFMFEINTHS
ncbi:protein arginine N-methyltransferase 7 isoform X2 [Anabrus simplex]|uniref:protein arginine N-methyltransferase 7 isoform X2 n=1 Tax=Anabrus simplex TaxID=316456 RepID=UPI0035A2E654